MPGMPEAPRAARLRRRRRHTWFDRLVDAVVYTVFAALLLPLALVVLFSFNNATSIAWPFKGFSLRWYAYLFNQPRVYDVTLNSLQLAALVALTATILGTLGGIALARHTFRGKAWLERLRLLPIVMPQLMIALGLVVLFVSIGFSLSLWAVAIGHITITLPFALIIIQSRMTGFDTRLEDASRDLGAGWAMTYRRIVLPIISPAIRAAFFFALIISLNEVIIAFFLAGYDTTLPVYMYGQFLRVITPESNAISGVMVALAGVMLLSERLVMRALTDVRSRQSL
jgi:spermidine/putrescine transport system permease protein